MREAPGPLLRVEACRVPSNGEGFLVLSDLTGIAAISTLPHPVPQSFELHLL